MLKLIDMYIFKGWTRKEKIQFLLSLLLTVIFCIVMLFVPAFLESVIRPHYVEVNTNMII